MKNGLVDIDHSLTYVTDLDAASRVWERLGFTLTPSSQIKPMGIHNRLVLLRSRTPGAANFIELMGVSDATRLPAPMRALLSGREGMKSMVLATPDAHAAQAQLVQAGYPFAPPSHVRREWVLPGEGSVWPEFDVLLPIPAPLVFNVCQYHNLSLYQRADWQQHRNGALCLLSCLATAPEPGEAVAFFERLFGRAAQAVEGGGRLNSPAATGIEVFTRADFAARFGVAPPAEAGASYAGMRIGVARLDTLRDCLREAQLPFADQGERIVVAPEQALGNALEFVEMPR